MTQKTLFGATRARLTAMHAYLSAGILLHAITSVELAIILLIDTMPEAHPLKLAALSIMALCVLFTQLDARSRFQEFKKVRDQLLRYGPDRRIFAALSRSRCQRDAALAAAGQLGHASFCRDHFFTIGYRWYHLLPDFASHHPWFLFSPTFLKATFFAPTYHARYSCRRHEGGSQGPFPFVGVIGQHRVNDHPHGQ